jgi:uncharacterized protein (TIGR02118 family)
MPMVKQVSFVRRNKALTHEEFEDYWVNVHAPLVAKSLPCLRRYTCSVPVKGHNPYPMGHDGGFDGVVEMCFDSYEDMQAGMNTPEWLSAERITSSKYLIDLESPSMQMVCEENVIVAGHGH